MKTIEKIKSSKVLIICSNGTTPHLETSLEVLEILKQENKVDFVHIGNYLSRPTLFPRNIIKRKLQLKKRVKKAELYIQPEWSKADEHMSVMLDFLNENPNWKLSLQTHKFLNIP